MAPGNLKQLITVFYNFLLIFILCTGCASKLENKSDDTNILKSADTEWENMFDGKSLDNWEITQFGPQGPVYVSEGSVVLGMGDGCTGITWQKNFPEMNYEVKLEAKKISGN